MMTRMAAHAALVGASSGSSAAAAKAVASQTTATAMLLMRIARPLPSAANLCTWEARRAETKDSTRVYHGGVGAFGASSSSSSGSQSPLVPSSWLVRAGALAEMRMHATSSVMGQVVVSSANVRPFSATLGPRYMSGSGHNAKVVVEQEDEQEEDDSTGRGTGSARGGGTSCADPINAERAAAIEAAEAEKKAKEEQEAKARIKMLEAARDRAEKVLHGDKRSALEIASSIASSVASGLWYVAVGSVKMAMYSPAQWQATFGRWWAAIKHEAHHYWVGTKLLAVDVRIASGLLLKVIRGHALTRREKKQLTRTTSDIFRLVPFAIFVIVPLGELLLPFALRVFPNMLPSTFEDKVKKDEELKRKLQAKIALAKFLQETLTEMAGDLRNSRCGETRASAEELYEFMKRVRAGEHVSQKEMLSHAKLFNDELTLDSLNRQLLNGMTFILNMSSTSGFLSDDILRMQIRKHLREIKEDDILIQQEGVDSLDESELRAACRSRGIKAQYGNAAVDGMKKGLKEWLDMTLKQNLPSSLLILTRVIRLMESGPKKEKTEEEYMQQTLAELEPVDVSINVQSGATAKERELELVLHQQQLIEEEEKRRVAMAAEEQRRIVEVGEDVAKTERGTAAAPDVAEKRRLEEQQELEEVAQALSVLASSSAVSNERAELMALLQKEIDAYNSRYSPDPGSRLMFDVRGGSGYVEDDVNEVTDSGPEMALSKKVDSMLSAINVELSAVEKKIGKNIRVLDSDGDGRVTPDEIVDALATLKKKMDDRLVREAIFDRLNLDTEGTVHVDSLLASMRARSKSSDEAGASSPSPSSNAAAAATKKAV